MHNKFGKYRIPNTEWFYDDRNTGELTFEKVVDELHSLFSSADYKKCNELRKSLVHKKEGDSNDN